ncbi:MAG: formate dehydrogenase accessory protein FdhE [Rhodocyclales bacterium GT-UBC]|nr:MAG: formate dehydrogenase accessory protein FdhE [Rhodocyclales bacterium GT-UBC]
MQSQPIDFHPPSEDTPLFLLPARKTIFAERAERFASLANEHSLADWLRFLGRLTAAQHTALQGLADLPLPDAEALSRAHTHGMPLLDTQTLPTAWHGVARQIAAELQADAPPTARAALETLATASDDELDRLTDALQSGEANAEQLARLPYVAAALQVMFTALASQLDAAQLRRLEPHGVCPCCGSLPVSSIVRLSPAVNNLRYLHCSLCNTEWNVSRAMCTACDSDKAVSQHQIEGGKDSIRAETCDSCKSYLKIAYQSKDPLVDPVADDLATLALDLLVDEAGYERSGPNLLLIGGAAQ